MLNGGKKQSDSRPVGRPPGLPAETAARSYRGKRKFSGAEIKQALRLNYGNPRLTALALCEAEKKAGGDRTIATETVRHYIVTRPAFQEIAQEARPGVLDLAEGVVVDALRAGDRPMARWLLERLGKDRGYTSRTEARLVLDPSQMTDEQLLQIFDPVRLTDAQLDLVLEHLASHLGNPGRLVIDNKPMPPP
ncbi:MAG: hypothetical protein WA459_25165 [Stellaceae bacterium]